MKILLTMFMFILFFSCSNDSAMTVDSSKIIGKSISWNSLPYGKGSLDGEKYINGKHYRVYCAEYKKKALVYVYEDSYIVDYFFSDSVRLYKAEKIPLGTDYEEVVKKLGEPVFLIYPGILYEWYNKEEYQGDFYCQYFRKRFNKISLRYELTQNMVQFSFNGDGKLEAVSAKWEWRP